MGRLHALALAWRWLDTISSPSSSGWLAGWVSGWLAGWVEDPPACLPARLPACLPLPPVMIEAGLIQSTPLNTGVAVAVAAAVLAIHAAAGDKFLQAAAAGNRWGT